ncbi:MAG: sigma-70 family RNA polymerase sigma factor [Myxococcota bacterium]
MIADSILVERARAHDELAFAGLVERYKARLLGYLTRLTGCPSRAEDLTQEAFLRFYERLDRYEEQGKLGAYLLRLATRIFLSEERRRRRRALLSLLIQVETDTSETSIIEHAYQRQVREALTRVPAHYRAPLVLFVVEGLTYHEIAEVLGVRPGTVKSRIARARAALRLHLASPEEEQLHERLVAR